MSFVCASAASIDFCSNSDGLFLIFLVVFFSMAMRFYACVRCVFLMNLRVSVVGLVGLMVLLGQMLGRMVLLGRQIVLNVLVWTVLPLVLGLSGFAFFPLNKTFEFFPCSYYILVLFYMPRSALFVASALVFVLMLVFHMFLLLLLGCFF